MIDATTWYLALLVMGVAGLLPAALLCERLPSLGILYARVVAFAAIALVTWLLAWSEVVPYGTWTALAVLAGMALWSAAIAWRRRDLIERIVERRRLLLAGEALLLAVFVLVTLARAQAPDAINTEKPMDQMLLVAVHRAETVPPPDPWLAGEVLSYYHLGHLGLDVIGRFSGNGPGIAFNLGVATAGALAAAAALGLIVDLLGLTGPRSRRALVVGGVVGLVTLLLAATVPGMVQVLSANGFGGETAWGWMNVDGVPTEAGATNFVPNAWLWWWPATRVVPGTITEFPAFTLLLGDPHAHLIAFPLVLVILALAVQTFEGGAPLTWRRWFASPDRLVLTAILFAALAMTNAWDLIVLGPLWGLAAIVAAVRVGWAPQLAIVLAARWAAAPAGLALLLAWPFLGGLDSPEIGIALVLDEHSDPLRWLLVWLPPLLPAAVGAAALWRRAPLDAYAGWGIAVAVALAVWVFLASVRGGAEALTGRASGWITILALGAAIAVVATQAMVADRARERAVSAAFALLGAGLAVLLLMELVQVDDAFPGRLNTVFKFGFQVWVILAIAGGALVGFAVERVDGLSERGRQWLFLGGYAVAVALLLFSLYSPAMAVSRGREGQAVGLDATRHLQDRDPGLAAAVQWSRVHLDPREHVVVQAIGESYGRGNRLSTFSGVPTVLAWPNHQRQWRGEIAESARRAAVDAIYAGSESDAQAAIERWGVTHVFVGEPEREAYGANVDDRFADWDVVLEADGVRILEVPR